MDFALRLRKLNDENQVSRIYLLVCVCVFILYFSFMLCFFFLQVHVDVCNFKLFIFLVLGWVVCFVIYH
jgi:hypothetical protein